MAIKKALFNIKGMTRDLAASKFSPQYAYENHNLRIVATDNNDTLSLVNEKGNVVPTINWDGSHNEGNYVFGTPIGQEILDNNLILFTAGEDNTISNISATVGTDITVGGTETTVDIDTEYEDRIYKFQLSELDPQILVGTKLFRGDLNFNTDNPIETLGLYENEDLEKVYWVDGLNQPRVINIQASAAKRSAWINDSFNFIRKFDLPYEIGVSKNVVAGGTFAPGVIQYCFTYYTNYGQQTNIFYVSPLMYVSYIDRGASAEDTVSNSFNISMMLLDTSFDYVRIYSILRTSINGTPQVRRVVDLAIPQEYPYYVSYVDDGTGGEAIDPTELFYIGGSELVVGSISQKDNTLFLGNLKINDTSLLNTGILDDVENATIGYMNTYIERESPTGYYSYECQLKHRSDSITTYKAGETYRFGIQFQDVRGNWSKPIFVADEEIPYSESSRQYNEYYRKLTNPRIHLDLSSSVEAIYNLGYVRVRPVVVFPTLSDRTIICQGVLCPTVYNALDRYSGLYDSMASWFFRPNAPYSTFYDYDNRESTSPSWTVDSTYTPVMSNYWYSLDGGDSFDSRINYGKWAEFRHNKKIPGNTKENAEIQCISHPPEPFLGCSNEGYVEADTAKEWVSQNKECFYVDQSVVTLNSPEIEFNPEVQNLDLSHARLRIVGYIPIDAQVSDIDITTSTPPLNYSKGSNEEYLDIAPGLYKEKVSFNYVSGGHYGWKSMLSGAFWLDEIHGSPVNNSSKYNAGFIVYPWHRNGSLNNTRSVSSSEVKSAMLQNKKMSILRYSADTVKFDDSAIWEAYVDGSVDRQGISGAVIFNSTENTIVKIPEPANSDIGELTYGGNIDKVITFHTTFKQRGIDSDLDNMEATNTSSFYPIVASLASYSRLSGETNDVENSNFRTSDSHKLFTGAYSRFRNIKIEQGAVTINDYSNREVDASSNDPVSMKYKSTPHAVIALNYSYPNNTLRNQVALPVHNDLNKVGPNSINSYGSCPATFSKPLFWDPHTENGYSSGWQSSGGINGVIQDSITLTDAPTTGYLWLGELYNPNIENRFGGQTDEAFENNQWVPAGNAVDLFDGETNTLSTTFILICKEGDTYYQRYDCLKTYPYTQEDQNSVVDILSFMVETHINIDGRYDRNRGQSNNLYMNPSNFNLINLAYSQQNNFFNYRTQNPNKLILDKFPNTITWSKTKTLGEEIDTWTNVTLASSIDLDGDKGPVRAIRNFNNNLLAFQDSGISQILYNENVQIVSSTGIPIEIANSGKVSGKRYITNHIGCTNKWSICSTPNGLYFLDSLRKDFYLFSGQQFSNLSDTLGFHSWVVNTISNNDVWNPVDYGSYRTLYDRVNGDVLITTEDTALAYSEQLQQFSSFYDYGDTPYFGNLEDVGIAWHKDNNNYYAPWLHRQGEYNKFFGEYKPFWTTVIVNPDPTEDKIFNNLEYRADGFSGDTYKPNYSFNYLRTWNEYQEGEANLGFNQNVPANLKKKFRVWRANIPRWNVNKNGQTANKRDRMRNPWLYLQLKMQGDNVTTNYKTVLHDLVVDYFE